MQGMPIQGAEPRALPDGKILPQYLRDLGYSTQMIGKWHLGFYMEKYTPTYRGFDSHLGYWNGLISYYDYILEEDSTDVRTLIIPVDFRLVRQFKSALTFNRFMFRTTHYTDST